MGCNCSQEEEPAPPPPHPVGGGAQISGPVDPPGMVPAPRRNEQGVPIPTRHFDLTRQNIERALGYVAEYLQARDKHLTLVAVGGAVNTVVLQSRTATHDVDFFNPPFSPSELSLLREAVDYAAERSSVPLGDGWLNNETGTIAGTLENIPRLTDSARQQNVTVFDHPNLTVFAAPWNYAFVAKIGRITRGTGRPYDQMDAVTYLRQYNLRHGGRSINVNEIHSWGRVWRRNTPEEILRQVDVAYQQTYREHGILFH